MKKIAVLLVTVFILFSLVITAIRENNFFTLRIVCNSSSSSVVIGRQINIDGSGITIVGNKSIDGTNRNSWNLIPIEEMKVVDITGISHIIVSSNVADIELLPTTESQAKVLITGAINKNAKYDFEVQENQNQLVVKFDAYGFIQTNNLKLSLYLPVTKAYESVELETTSNDVCLTNISAFNVKCMTSSGDISIEDCFFSKGEFEAFSGDVKLRGELFSNLEIEAETSSGDIECQMRNVAEMELELDTRSGKISNKSKFDGGYLLKGNFSTMSGDISIQ